MCKAPVDFIHGSFMFAAKGGDLYRNVLLLSLIHISRRFFEQNGVRRIILPESGENSWFSGFGRVDALPFYRALSLIHIYAPCMCSLPPLIMISPSLG